jgi:hypothetical protein
MNVSLLLDNAAPLLDSVALYSSYLYNTLSDRLQCKARIRGTSGVHTQLVGDSLLQFHATRLVNSYTRTPAA